jgi:hypothetical protein
MTYVLENDGTISHRPFCVARGMMARQEARKLLTNQEAKVLMGQRDAVHQTQPPATDRNAKR